MPSTVTWRDGGLEVRRVIGDDPATSYRQGGRTSLEQAVDLRDGIDAPDHAVRDRSTCRSGWTCR